MNPALTFLAVLLWTSTCVQAQQPTSQSVTSGVTGIGRVSLSVCDLDRAVAFYTGALGLTEVRRYAVRGKVPIEKKSGIKSVARQVALLGGPNGQIELIQFDGAANQPASTMPIPGPGITHVCYQSPVASGLYAKTKASGGTIVSRGNEPVDRGAGIQYAYAKDTDGILFELEQLVKPPFTNPVWMGHVALATPDIDRLVGFYTQLLGTEPLRRINNIRNNPKLDDIAGLDSLHLRVAWFKAGKMVLEIWQFDNPPTRQPDGLPDYTRVGYASISFQTAALNQDYERLRAAGVTFLSAPTATTDATAVLLRDPDGNLLRLEQPSPNAPLSADRPNRSK